MGDSDRPPHTPPSPVDFRDVDDLLLHVSTNWQQHFVTLDIHTSSDFEAVSKRPFFLLVNIDAPISLRFQRSKQRCVQRRIFEPTLEAFIQSSDAQLFGPQRALYAHADIHLVNSGTSLSTLHAGLEKLDLPNPERLRPTWDQYFMQLAALAAMRSNCMKRRVGCVLVRDKRVISTGYNGTPRYLKNCNEGGCARCNAGAAGGTGLATCLCLHAEENALLEAGRERVGGEAVLYCDTCPCLTCSIKITQVGITEVVYAKGYSMDEEAARIFKEAKVSLRRFVPPRKGVVIERLESGKET
jgi:dCMP deaminase